MTIHHGVTQQQQEVLAQKAAIPPLLCRVVMKEVAASILFVKMIDYKAKNAISCVLVGCFGC